MGRDKPPEGGLYLEAGATDASFAFTACQLKQKGTIPSKSKVFTDLNLNFQSFSRRPARATPNLRHVIIATKVLLVSADSSPAHVGRPVLAQHVYILLELKDRGSIGSSHETDCSNFRAGMMWTSTTCHIDR
jgi:hypothetical protein